MKIKLLLRRFLSSEAAVLGLIALLKLVIHLLTSQNYGYYNDELYFLDCGKHLDWGFVEIPPLIPALSILVRNTLGTSLLALHILPAVAGAVMVFMAGWIARELGGGKLAQALTALLAIMTPVWLSMNSLFHYDPFDQLITVVFLYTLIILLKRDNPKLWLLIGLIGGIGAMVKLAIPFFGVAMLLGMLLTRERKYFTSKWLWIGGVIGLLIFSPYVMWQWRHGWPLVENLHYYNQLRYPNTTFLSYFDAQKYNTLPLTMFIWVPGLLYLLLAKNARSYRLLGWMYPILFTIFVLLHCAQYMIAPMYAVLFAAGSIVLERWVKSNPMTLILSERSYNLKPYFFILAPVLILTMILGNIFNAPDAFPVLTTEQMAKRWADRSMAIPEYFMDRFGWEDMTKVVAKVYHSLSPEEQAKCVIITRYHTETSALNFFGPKYGLPEAFSGNLSPYYWGPPPIHGEIAIMVGKFAGLNYFNRIEIKEYVDNKYSMPYEAHLPIYLCREPRMTMAKMWPMLRDMIW